MSIKVIAKRGLFVLERYAPEILTYGGLVTMIGGTVLACKQTPKAVLIIEDTKQQLAVIKATKEEAEANNGQIVRMENGTAAMISYSKNDFQKDLAIAHVNNVKALAKTYAIPAALLIGGAACVLGGHGILRKRNAVAIATLGSALEGWNKYRKNVIAELGEEADKRYRYGLPAPETVETINAETGEITREPAKGPSGFAEFPEDDPRFLLYSQGTCPEFYKANLLADLAHLKSCQNTCNDKLRIYGHLTVNEAREIIGARAIPEGLDNGWVIDGDGDGEVDFNLFDPLTGEPKSWVYEYVKEGQGIPVEFNIDGNIKAMLKRPRNAR